MLGTTLRSDDRLNAVAAWILEQGSEYIVVNARSFCAMEEGYKALVMPQGEKSQPKNKVKDEDKGCRESR